MFPNVTPFSFKLRCQETACVQIYYSGGHTSHYQHSSVYTPFFTCSAFIKLLCCFTLKRLRGTQREVAPSYSLVAGHINERQTSSSPLVLLMNESGFIVSAQDRRSAGRRLEFGVIRRRQSQSARRSGSHESLLSFSKERLCLGLITFPLFHYLQQCVFSQ